MSVPTVLRDKVCVKLNEVEEKSPGGLYIPSTVDQDIVEGTVVSVGNGHLLSSGKFSPLTLKEGDVVSFKKSSSTLVSIKGEKFFVMHEADVVCKH